MMTAEEMLVATLAARLYDGSMYDPINRAVAISKAIVETTKRLYPEKQEATAAGDGEAP